MTDILEVIGGFSMPLFSLQQLALLFKVAKVSHMVEIVYEGYSTRTSIRHDEKHDRDTFVARYLGYSEEISTPIQTYGST